MRDRSVPRPRRSRADLDTDIKLQLALTRAISTIGEAARRTAETFRAAHPEINWSAITGMRHKLVHDYFNVDLNIVWTAATIQVPELLSILQQIELDEGKVT